MHAEQLRASSQKWMNAALAAFSHGPDSYDFAVHHAGIAAEHILKAYLAGLHPALIVEGKDFDSLLHATGHGTHASIPLNRVKTIGLVEAHARSHRLLRGQIPIDQRTLMPLANARNGVAHSGIHDAAEVSTVFTTCLRLIDPILRELKIDSAVYWAPYEDLHDRLIEERVAEARIQLESKLAQARTVFAQRFGHLSAKEREVVLATVVRKRPAYMDHEEPKPCPACAAQGWLVGDTHVEGAVVMFTPYIFVCSACDLDIEGEDFWELGDLTNEIALEQDPADYYADWEPDEDLYRER